MWTAHGHIVNFKVMSSCKSAAKQATEYCFPIERPHPASKRLLVQGSGRQRKESETDKHHEAVCVLCCLSKQLSYGNIRKSSKTTFSAIRSETYSGDTATRRHGLVMRRKSYVMDKRCHDNCLQGYRLTSSSIGCATRVE